MMPNTDDVSVRNQLADVVLVSGCYDPRNTHCP